MWRKCKDGRSVEKSHRIFNQLGEGIVSVNMLRAVKSFLFHVISNQARFSFPSHAEVALKANGDAEVFVKSLSFGRHEKFCN